MGDEFIRDARTSARYGWGECEVCDLGSGLRVLTSDGWMHLACILPAVASPHTPTPSPKDSERVE